MGDLRGQVQAIDKGSLDVAKRDALAKLPKRLQALYDLMCRKGIDLADMEAASVRNAGFYEGQAKNADDEIVVTTMSRIEFAPAWEQGPAWPPCQPATPSRIVYGKRPKPRTDGLRVAVLLPDTQIGFWRDIETGELVPMHDEDAIDVAFQIARDARPYRMVQLGDFLDLAEMSSKFAPWPEFVHTAQPTIVRGHHFAAEMRVVVGPDGEADVMDGNHDDRLGKAVLANARWAMRLRRADATPEDWPAMSVPNLLALDAVGVAYHDGYPATALKLADGNGSQTPLYAVHERGLDVVKVAKQQRHSIVQGHTHRVAQHSESYDFDGGRVDVEAWSLGTLSRVDGYVPSTKGTPDLKGRPVGRTESWQQAVGILTLAPDGSWNLETVRIRDGRAIWNGRMYEADPEAVARRTQLVRLATAAA